MILAERTAPHQIPGTFIISVWHHGNALVTQRRAIFVNADRIRDRLGPSAPAVQVDESVDTTILEKTVGGHVVHGRIKAHVLGRKGFHILLHFVERDEKTDRVMLSGTGKTEQKGHIRMQGRVVARELE